jgi:hypothetical protein
MTEPIRTANISQPGFEADDQGDPAGKDPGLIGQAELQAAGNEPMPILKVVHHHELDALLEMSNGKVGAMPMGYVSNALGHRADSSTAAWGSDGAFC